MTPLPADTLTLDDLRRVARQLDDAQQASLERYARLLDRPPELVGTLGGRWVRTAAHLAEVYQRPVLELAPWPVLA